MISYEATILCDNGDCQERVSGINAHAVDISKNIALNEAAARGWITRRNGDHFCGTCAAPLKKKKGGK